MRNPMLMRPHLLVILALAARAASVSVAGVGDPTIQTDHPTYAGEGAFQTVERSVAFAVNESDPPQQQAIDLYHWLLTHQFHLMSPQEWCVPGRTPNAAETKDYESVVYDANRGRFSYGYGLCGTVYAWNEPYWKALGMKVRRRAFPGHVNSEVFYDGSWHAFDTDMAGLLFREDGVVAGYDDLIRNPDLAKSVQPPIPHYPFAWPGDFEAMQKGWEEVARGGNWYSMYNGGYAAHPGIVELRPGETFTRWFDRDHYGGPTKRRFWHNQPGGPFRNWTFVNEGEPTHDGDRANSRGNASYCNGEFVYQPDLADAALVKHLAARSGAIGQRSDSPRLYSENGRQASVTFRHFSPYVIAGDPEDDANPMTGPATGGLVVAGKLVGQVAIEVSADAGQTWHAVEPEISSAEGDVRSFEIDLTDHVKGRYGWQLRFTWEQDAGLDELKFTTVTQVAQAIYPRLNVDGCAVTYRCGSRGVLPVLPNFSLPGESAAAFEAVELRSPNVRYQGGPDAQRLKYVTTDNKPGQVVFRIDSPRALDEVRAAIRYQVRVPPPEEHEYKLEVSTDDGATWTEFARAEIPADNEFSSGWLSGSADIFSAHSSQALVRATFFAGGHQTGLIDAQLYGVYRTPPADPLVITYGWEENGELRTHVQLIGAEVRNDSFIVPTGGVIRDRFIRLETPPSKTAANDLDPVSEETERELPDPAS